MVAMATATPAQAVLYSPSKWEYNTDEGRFERKPAYHGDREAQYCLSNDSPEKLRLKAQAYFLSSLMNHRIVHAPLQADKATHVLDIGCGTGAVTDTLAKLFPAADCYGLDLSEITEADGHPTNVAFLRGNILTQNSSSWVSRSGDRPLPDGEGQFDYVYSRLLLLGMTDWPGLMKREFKLLKPGGWTEAHDTDATHFYDGDGKSLSDDWEWNNAFIAATAKKGIDWGCGSNMKARMIEAGFVDVQEFKYQWPLGANARSEEDQKEFARFTDISFPELFYHAAQRLLEGDAPQQEIKRLQTEIRQTLSPDVKMWIPMVATVGRKPF